MKAQIKINTPPPLYKTPGAPWLLISPAAVQASLGCDRVTQEQSKKKN